MPDYLLICRTDAAWPSAPPVVVQIVDSMGTGGQCGL